MQDANNQIPIDIFAATCHILQDSFSLTKINEGKFRMILSQFEFGLIVKFANSCNEFFLITGKNTMIVSKLVEL